MDEQEFDKIFKEAQLPNFILQSPITAEWVDYQGKRKFAMLNFDKSIEKGRLMIDLCYCATAGLINGRVERTVPYREKHFAIVKDWFKTPTPSSPDELQALLDS